TATTGRPGPVFLEIPIDVLFGRADEAKAVFPQHVCPEAAPTPAPEAVIRALDWRAAAERPAIMAGGGAWFSGGGPALLAFVALGIVADCREALRALEAAAGERRWPDRTACQRAAREAREVPRRLFAPALESDAAPIHPFRLAHEVARAAGPEAILVADGGETASWLELAADVRGGGRWLSHGYLGCLGTGMPFAIAAKVAYPARPVVCLVGDGSVGLNFAEFDTMVRHRLPIVTVVNNDRQWGMSAHGQDLIFGEGRRVVTDLAPTRYDLAAAGFGCHAEHVEAPADLGSALRRALAAGRPACVDVRTDRQRTSPRTVGRGGARRP